MININKDDYQDDRDDWGGWDDQDHRHCNSDFVTLEDDQGGWDKVNE